MGFLGADQKAPSPFKWDQNACNGVLDFKTKFLIITAQPAAVIGGNDLKFAMLGDGLGLHFPSDDRGTVIARSGSIPHVHRTVRRDQHTHHCTSLRGLVAAPHGTSVALRLPAQQLPGFGVAYDLTRRVAGSVDDVKPGLIEREQGLKEATGVVGTQRMLSQHR